jgi:hypothetical protein
MDTQWEHRDVIIHNYTKVSDYMLNNGIEWQRLAIEELEERLEHAKRRLDLYVAEQTRRTTERDAPRERG